ncbi:hypothetical protein [Brevundimonas sp.]|uniref:hypothetical protein n=1 Tax=Brevundimonas sp. TaxID=1871086 RepID=UPI00391DB1E0
MRDYTTIDHSQEPPTSADLRPAFAHSGVHARPLDPRIARVQALFHEDRTSARMAAVQFDLDLDPAGPSISSATACPRPCSSTSCSAASRFWRPRHPAH